MIESAVCNNPISSLNEIWKNANPIKDVDIIPVKFVYKNDEEEISEVDSSGTETIDVKRSCIELTEECVHSSLIIVTLRS